MPNIGLIRRYVSRVAGAFLAGGTVAIATELEAGIAAVAAFLVYSLTHRTTDAAGVNPKDEATSDG